MVRSSSAWFSSARVEHPGVQPTAPAVAAVVAERAFLGLVEPGRVPVGGDGLVGDHLAVTCGHSALHWRLGAATSAIYAATQMG